MLELQFPHTGYGRYVAVAKSIYPAVSASGQGPVPAVASLGC